MNASRREFLRCFAMSAAVATATGSGLATLARAADDNRPEKWVKGVCRYCGTGLRRHDWRQKRQGSGHSGRPQQS